MSDVQPERGDYVELEVAWNDAKARDHTINVRPTQFVNPSHVSQRPRVGHSRKSPRLVSSPRRAPPHPIPSADDDVKSEGDRLYGSVFALKKKYGFLQLENGDLVFFDMQQVAPGPRELRVTDTVEFSPCEEPVIGRTARRVVLRSQLSSFSTHVSGQQLRRMIRGEQFEREEDRVNEVRHVRICSAGRIGRVMSVALRLAAIGRLFVACSLACSLKIVP